MERTKRQDAERKETKARAEKSRERQEENQIRRRHIDIDDKSEIG
jgi:hypothetical protein